PRTRSVPESRKVARNHNRFVPRLLTPAPRVARMVDREPQPFGGLTVRVRIRGRDQRPEQGKQWSEEPQKPLQPQGGDEGAEAADTESASVQAPVEAATSEVSEDPVTVADEMYEDVATPDVVAPEAPPAPPAPEKGA